MNNMGLREIEKKIAMKSASKVKEGYLMK